MSRKTKPGKFTTETFPDVALHPKMYRFDETLERLPSNVELHTRKEVTTNDNNENGTTLCNYEFDYEVSPVVDTSHLCASKLTCLETSEAEQAEQSEKPFEAWMEATEKLEVERLKKN